MDKLQIFNNDTFGEIRAITKNGEPWFVGYGIGEALKKLEAPTQWHGYVYAMEIGECVKIGHTTNIYQRIAAHERDAQKYACHAIGAVLFSQPHTNHLENERLLHRQFAAYRKSKAEMFCLRMQDLWQDLPDLVFADESQKKEMRAQAFTGFLKSVALGEAGL